MLTLKAQSKYDVDDILKSILYILQDKKKTKQKKNNKQTNKQKNNKKKQTLATIVNRLLERRLTRNAKPYFLLKIHNE